MRRYLADLDDLWDAVEWLLACESDGPEGEACKRVAEWLTEETARLEHKDRAKALARQGRGARS